MTGQQEADEDVVFVISHKTYVECVTRIVQGMYSGGLCASVENAISQFESILKSKKIKVL